MANTVTLVNDTNFTLAGGQTTLRADAVLVQEPFVGTAQEFNALPAEFVLGNNYPNPFNPTTNIDFQVPYSAKVELKVFNILGQQITTLVSGNLPAGSYSVQWNGLDMFGKSVASGMYFYQMRTPQGNQTHKMLFLK